MPPLLLHFSLRLSHPMHAGGSPGLALAVLVPTTPTLLLLTSSLGLGLAPQLLHLSSVALIYDGLHNPELSLLLTCLFLLFFSLFLSTSRIVLGVQHRRFKSQPQRTCARLFSSPALLLTLNSCIHHCRPQLCFTM